MDRPRLLDLLLPTVCAACLLPGAPVCGGCRDRVTPIGGTLCRGCGRPTPVPVDRCAECRGRLDWSRQALVYEGVAAALVVALKDRRRRDVAPELARFVTVHIPPPPLGAVLVPVPGGRARVRERGFDQARLIARSLGEAWARPVAAALVRARDRPAQRGAGRRERVRRLAGTFAPAPDGVPPFPVLIDDVRTTGATLAECAAALRAGGAVRVGAICATRVARQGDFAPGGTVGGGSISAEGSTHDKERRHAAAGEGEERLRHRRALRARGTQARAADEDSPGLRG
jgi:predicted amidophosphoribosyltransferase